MIGSWGKGQIDYPPLIAYLKHRRQDNNLKPTVSTWVTMPSKLLLVSEGFAAEVDGVSLCGTVQPCSVTSLISLAILCTWDGHKHWTLRGRQACISTLIDPHIYACMPLVMQLTNISLGLMEQLSKSFLEAIPWWKLYSYFLQTWSLEWWAGNCINKWQNGNWWKNISLGNISFFLFN